MGGSGFNPTNKKSRKISEIWIWFWILEIVILSKIIGYYFQKSGQLAAPKNQIQFFQIYPKKFEGSKFSKLSLQKIGFEIICW